jgi:hypothetical protein
MVVRDVRVVSPGWPWLLRCHASQLQEMINKLDELITTLRR